MAVVTYSAAGAFTWLCPAGIFTVKCETWGSGGGGAAFDGGGGGAAAYACEPALAVTPGKLYTFTIAAGGAGSSVLSATGAGADGGTTVFTGDRVTVSAAGGGGALAIGVTTYGGAGALAGSNTVSYAGGAGGNGSIFYGTGGGGGGSGGNSSAGNAGGNGGASGGAGALAVAGGGSGGAGSAAGAGAAGGAPGGGGGGGSYQGAGGNGAAGQVQLTYTVSLEPAIPVFVAGYSPQPADMDSWIQAPFSFLTSKVVFRAELSNALTLAQNAATLIPYNVIDEDPYAGWQSATSQWLCPAGCTGTYEVSVTCSMGIAPDVTTALQPQLYLNGSYIYTLATTWAPTAQPCLVSGSFPIQLYGGQDLISAYAYLQSSAANSAITTAGQRCTIEVTWISL
jgi:hypothetical protein